MQQQGLAERLEEGNDCGIDDPLMSICESDLRSLCRRRIEALEHWLKRLITDVFTESYGKDYWLAELAGGQRLVKADIQKTVNSRMNSNPDRFPRWIDAVSIGDIKHFICRDEMYTAHFHDVFEPFYSGSPELESVLERLLSVRNKLSHGNTMSIHEAEQVICYSDDIINCIKGYYSNLGKARKYNVPLFLRAMDSMGNEFVREDYEHTWEITHPPNAGMYEKIELHSGDYYKIWVEVDGSFPEDSYTVSWMASCNWRVERGLGNAAEILLRDEDVSLSLSITFSLKTTHSWHKHANAFDRDLDYDDKIEWKANKEILPPIASTY